MGGKQKSCFLCLPPEPRCSAPLMHRVVCTLLYRVVTELRKAMEKEWEVPERSDAASATPWSRRRCYGQSPFKSMAWVGCLFSFEILSTAQPPEWPSGSTIWSLRIMEPAEQNTEVFPFPPNPFWIIQALNVCWNSCWIRTEILPFKYSSSFSWSDFCFAVLQLISILPKCKLWLPFALGFCSTEPSAGAVYNITSWMTLEIKYRTSVWAMVFISSQSILNFMHALIS